MPSLNIKLEPGGAIITVGIGVSMPRATALRKAKLPVPPVMMVRGLIDTGASCTCVDPEVISQLGIAPTGTADVFTPTTDQTPEVRNQFDVAIVVAMDSQIHVHSLIIPVVETHLKTLGFQVLIGRDILNQATMFYDGPRQSLTLTF